MNMNTAIEYGFRAVVHDAAEHFFGGAVSNLVFDIAVKVLTTSVTVTLICSAMPVTAASIWRWARL